MHYFTQKKGQLFAENVAVSKLTRQYGSPLYVYSAQTLIDNYRRLNSALAEVDPMICYAMKANSNLAVLDLLAKEGCGFDTVSGGEIFRVLKAGGKTDRCTFAGVGKTREEIEFALKKGIYAFNVESQAELQRINDVAKKLKKQAPIAIRVNPNVDADTHAKITTGTYENKFGIPYEEIPALYARASKMSNIWLRGVQMHIGSQITKVKPFRDAVKKMLPLVLQLKERYAIEFFDIGGGIGIVYDPALASGSEAWWKKQKNPPLTPEAYARVLVPLLKKLGLKILVEPGRYMAGNAGILVAEVVYVKKTAHKNFVIIDAAMNDLIRPSFYESYHEIVPLQMRRGKAVSTDVVGPICESGDTFCKNRMLPPLKEGDQIAFMSAGAYGFVMAGTYNSRPMAAEVLVKGKTVHLARKRQSMQDVIRGELVMSRMKK